MKKKGFTLIELLAVIVILAVVALIITPVVSDIIVSARHSANARSVEGHVKNIEYAIVNETFNSAKELSYYNMDSGTDKIDELTIPDSDKVTCTSYTIQDGEVLKALNCRDTVKDWDRSYNYIKGTGAIAASSNFSSENILDGLDLTTSNSVSYGNRESGRNATISLNEGNYLVYVSYAESYGNTTGGANITSSNEFNLTGTNATCDLMDQKGYSYSATEAVDNIYQTLTNVTKVYKCKTTASTDVSYTSTLETNNTMPQGIILQAVEIKGNDNLCPTSSCEGGSGGTGGGSNSGNTDPWGGVAGPTSTLSSGQTVYEGHYLANVIPFYFNVSTGTKCSNNEWTTNNGGSSYGMKSGCLKFLAYMEDNLSYTMILDRNTNDRGVIWSSAGSNSSGPIEAAALLKSETSNWQGTITPSNYTRIHVANGIETSYVIPYDTDGYHARFITTDEIAHITGNNEFNSVSTGMSGWFYFDGATAVSTGATWQTQMATSSQISAYPWLYNYINSCTRWGCGVAGEWYGYWTSDSVANTSNQAWFVYKTGSLGYKNNFDNNSMYIDGMGIRPVITVLKSTLD